MVGLQASYFRRIYKGLLLDLILTIVSPIVIIILGYLVSGQMEAAGLAVGEMSSADAARSATVAEFRSRPSRSRTGSSSSAPHPTTKS